MSSNKKLSVIFDGQCLGFHQGVPAEIDKGLGGLGDIAVFFPGKPDFQIGGNVKRHGFQARGVVNHQVKEAGYAYAAANQALDGFDLVGFQHDVGADVFRPEFFQQKVAEERAFLQHDEIHILEVFVAERGALGQGVILLHTGDDAAVGNGEAHEAGGHVAHDDDAEVDLVLLQVIPDVHGAFFVEVDVEMGIPLLEVGKDHGEEVGADHGGNADFYSALLELLVVVDLQNGVLNIPEGQLDSGEEDRALRGEGQLLLAAVKKLNAQLAFQLFYGHGNIGLGNPESFGRPRDVFQPGRHLKVFQLSKLHSDSFHSTLLCKSKTNVICNEVLHLE